MAKFLLASENINDENSFVIENIEVSPNLGGVPTSPLSLVSSARDINGDDIAELIVQPVLIAPNDGTLSRPYVIFGSSSLSDNIERTDLNGSNGFSLSNELTAVFGAADINRDNLNELVALSANFAVGTTSTSIVLGANEFSETVDISALDGNNGFNVIDPGKSVTPISFFGDVNNDGINDLAFFSGGIEGQTFVNTNKVVFGRESYPANLDISTLDGNNGFSVTDGTTNLLAISGAGAEINGDQFDDLIYTVSDSSIAYVLFGRSEFAAEVNLATLPDDQGFTIIEAAADPEEDLFAGFSQDINGDGQADLVLSKTLTTEPAEGENPEILSRGVFVIYGSDDIPATFDLASIDGNNGFTVGSSEVGIGGVLDINGDGLQDLFIDSDLENKTYVIFGGADIPNNFDLTTLNGSNGFVIENPNVGAGLLFNVGLFGDINGDGINDVVIGDEDLTTDNPDYILLGSREFPASIDLTDPDANVIQLEGEGITEGISNIADVNGDDVDDIIFFAQLQEDNTSLADNTVLFGDRNLSFVTDNSGEEPDPNPDPDPDPDPEDNAPTVVNPISDLNFTESGEDQSIDLSDVFADADEDPITVALLSNSNEDLVTASIAENNLVLDFTEDQSGTADITVRATANGQTVDDTFTVTVGSDEPEPEPNPQTIDLFRFRNITFDTGTYIFVGEEERDFILGNEDLQNIFALDGVAEDGTINPAFTASTVDSEGLIPFYRLESLTRLGTFLFVSTAEYDGIFAEDSNQKDQWKKQGFDPSDETIDIPEFYLRDGSADSGTTFNRFQNQANGTFLYAGGAEIEAIENDPNLRDLFKDQDVAFKSLS